MYFLTIYFTFINFLIAGLYGKCLGNKGVCLITSFFLLVSFINSLFIYYEVVILCTPCIIETFNWFYTDLLLLQWNFYFDSLTSTMLLIITFISFCAHLYSIEYMKYDPHQSRFMAYLSLFTFFMIILVSSGNFIQLFVGWEGVGICSYLLINFWYTRLSANKSAMMAVFTNRIGDVSLMIGFGFVFFIYKSFNFDVVLSCINTHNNINYFFLNEITLFYYFICGFFIVGAVGKSAQIGLHIWLPEAMEGPTPVSSLIHAATMVTAGIFLIIRCSYLFEFFPYSLLWIVFIGSLTTLFASSIGIVQNDLKKIIAYSTCSQLGYMFLACGLSGYNYSLFHLFNHAFFKALLFLTAGYVIHSINNEQDIRKMGLLYKFLPFSNIMILYASLSLVGFDFTSGYYSKDKIIELFYNRYSLTLLDNLNFNIYILLQFLSTIAIYCTIIYSIKLSIYVFYGFTVNSYFLYIKNYKLHIKEYFVYSIYMYNNKIDKIYYSHTYIYVVLSLLFITSMSSGYTFRDIMIGEGIMLWNESFSITNYYNLILNNNFIIINFEFYEYFRNILHEWIFYLLVNTMYIYYFTNRISISYMLYSSTYLVYYYKFLVEKFIIFNKIIIDLFSIYLLNTSYTTTYLLIDKGLIDKLGPFNIYIIIKFLTSKLKEYRQLYSSNFFTSYLISFFLVISLIV